MIIPLAPSRMCFFKHFFPIRPLYNILSPKRYDDDDEMSLIQETVYYNDWRGSAVENGKKQIRIFDFYPLIIIIIQYTVYFLHT